LAGSGSSSIGGGDLTSSSSAVRLSIIENICDKNMHINEKWFVILFQVLFPFFVAGFGMVAAGVLLDYVQVKENLD
jgi:hypothetical protein